MIDTILTPILSLVTKFVPDKDQANKLAHELSTMAERHAHEARLEQIKTNQEAAKHPSMFVAGARPAILWICAMGFAWALFLYDWVIAILALSGVSPETIALIPVPREGLLMWSMGGLLGLGAMRSYEKVSGVARENLKATPNVNFTKQQEETP